MQLDEFMYLWVCIGLYYKCMGVFIQWEVVVVVIINLCGFSILVYISWMGEYKYVWNVWNGCLIFICRCNVRV